MTTGIQINGATYQVNFGLYALSDFAANNGLKNLEELLARFESGDVKMIIDLCWYGLQAGSVFTGQPLDLDENRFKLGFDAKLLSEFTDAFTKQFATSNQDPMKPARAKARK